MSGRKQWNKQAATSSSLDKKLPKSLVQQGLEGSTAVGKDEVTSSNLVSSSMKTRCPTRDGGFFFAWINVKGREKDTPKDTPEKENSPPGLLREGIFVT